MQRMLQFYYDAFSQPCRAVWLLLEANEVPHTLCLINIARGTYFITVCTLSFKDNTSYESKNINVHAFDINSYLHEFFELIPID